MGLTKKDGTAITTAAGVPTASVPVTDPIVRVTEDVFHTFAYPGDFTGTKGQQLLFNEGALVKQSEIDGHFPSIATVSPATGLAAGGAAVTITGTNLTATTGVTFGGVAATNVVVGSHEKGAQATSITCTAPAHAAGAVSVVVTSGGATATKTTAFTYS